MRIAHARINEIGRVTGGLPGDQTGHEVETTAYFEFEWTTVFRYPSLAERIATYAQQICNNNHIGYGQGDRYTMWQLAKANGWRFDKINQNCATDCSQMVATICQACGLPVSTYMYTGSETGELQKAGFSVMPYTGSASLKRGDILLTTKRGHTAVVLDSGSGGGYDHTPKWVGEVYGIQTLPVRTEPREGASLLPEWRYLGLGNLFDVCDTSGSWLYIRIAGQYYGWIPMLYCLRKSPQKVGTVSTDLHLRANAGAQYKSLAIMPRGANVEICDQKPTSTGAKWDYVIYNGQYGFCSDRYIRS